MASVQKIIQSMAANHVLAMSVDTIKAVRTAIITINQAIALNQTKRNIRETVTADKHIKQMKAVKKIKNLKGNFSRNE